jgi:hypothetical protein
MFVAKVAYFSCAALSLGCVPIWAQYAQVDHSVWRYAYLFLAIICAVCAASLALVGWAL